MTEINLSRKEFKALSSETRTELLKLLMERNHNLSELSKKTDLAAPTVKQHLEKLCNAGLIQAVDDHRKWKYYALTRKGRELLEPKESTSIFIMIAASSVALLGILYTVFSRFSLVAGTRVEQAGDKLLAGTMDKAVPETAAETGKAAVNGMQQVLQLGFNDAVLVFLGIIFFSALTGFLLAKIHK